MNVADSRIVVTRPDGTAAGAVVAPNPVQPSKRAELIAGQSFFMYVARGTGRYRVGRNRGFLRPNLLISASAGAFCCEPDDDECEAYVVVGSERGADPKDLQTFVPTFERQLDDLESRRWRDRMAEAAITAAGGRLAIGDARAIAGDAMALVWRPGSDAARVVMQRLFERVWDRIAEPLSLGSLADEAGYTPNYLNDLARAATGRPIGAWIADVRMNRARAYLETTEMPIASVGVACGFDDPSYFARAFRAVHGVTPATWRLSARPDDPRFAAVAMPFEEFHAAAAATAQIA
jgi:AraC-like DNA-binding protein